MLLCLDLGNTQLHGGLFDDEELILQFRKASKKNISSDEFGLFLKDVINQNDIDSNNITDISICSVVPSLNHSLINACVKYFGIDPFLLKPGVKTGLKIKYNNPIKVGADRIANAIAVSNLYRGKNVIVVDFGTATTLCAINSKKEYLGGIILPGIKISMDALEQNTALLPIVEIRAIEKVIGKTTIESIQSGLYHGQIGMINELVGKITEESFEETPIVIGTGGFSRLYVKSQIFDKLIPTLALEGLKIAFIMNSKNEEN